MTPRVDVPPPTGAQQAPQPPPAGRTEWQWALQGPSTSRTQPRGAQPASDHNPAPARSPGEFCFFPHVAAGCLSQISQKKGVLSKPPRRPALLRSSHLPSWLSASQGSCSLWTVIPEQAALPRLQGAARFQPPARHRSLEGHSDLQRASRATASARASARRQSSNQKSLSHQRSWITGKPPGQTLQQPRPQFCWPQERMPTQSSITLPHLPRDAGPVPSGTQGPWDRNIPAWLSFLPC